MCVGGGAPVCPDLQPFHQAVSGSSPGGSGGFFSPSGVQRVPQVRAFPLPHPPTLLCGLLPLAPLCSPPRPCFTHAAVSSLS